MRSTGVPSEKVSVWQAMSSTVNGVWPMMPTFHSTPPEIHALRSARLQGWKTGFTCSSSRPASLSNSDQRRPPSCGMNVARRCSFSSTAALKARLRFCRL